MGDPRCINIADNVVHCDKLFMVNGIMKWLYNKLSSEEIDIDSMREYLLLINEYLDDNVELSWEHGELSYVKKETY